MGLVTVFAPQGLAWVSMGGLRHESCPTTEKRKIHLQF